MFGAPGSGKGTQCQFLRDRLGLEHCSTGEILRRHVAEQTDLGRAAEEVMRRGDLVPDDLVSAIVGDTIARLNGAGLVLDGFPRTVAQAEALDGFLAASGRSLTAVISLKLPTATLVRRLANRRVCTRCGRVYNLALAPTLTACEVDGAALVQRPDDAPDAVRRRLDLYLTDTAPVLAFYGERGQVIKIDSGRSIPDVRDDIERRLRALEEPRAGAHALD